MHSRRAAALGMCLYTASLPKALRFQRAAFRLTHLLGARALPGTAQSWAPDFDEWDVLLRTWRREIGPFDSWAVYRRRQASRSGLTILLADRSRPLAVTKIRDEAAALTAEQQALNAVRRAGVTAFQVPEALGVGTLDNGLTWSAQTAVFDAPHAPVFTPPPALFEEVSDALASIVHTEPEQAPAHNDLTPWNLRIDRHGATWLFDWEDIGAAPLGADRCYFYATSHALNETPMPPDLQRTAMDHWSAAVAVRRADSSADAQLKAAILSALDVAGRLKQAQEVAANSTI